MQAQKDKKIVRQRKVRGREREKTSRDRQPRRTTDFVKEGETEIYKTGRETQR